MNSYEKQLQSAVDKNVQVIESYDMGNDPDHPPIDGLYVDGCVALSSDLQTAAQKNTILAEELAHHDLTVGDILDLSDPGNRRQEQKARTLAYDRLIGLQGLDRAIKSGCKNRFEAAEFLEVTEQFLQEAIDRYKEIYGPALIAYLDSHLSDTVRRQEPATPDPVPEQTAPADQKPALSQEEVQRRIARIRKRKKKPEAERRKRDNYGQELVRRGYDFFKVAEDQYLDPER